MNTSNNPSEKQPFPTFATLAEAKAYSEKTGDAYFQIWYKLEGNLDLCIKTMNGLYANAPSTKRPKMQTGLGRNIISSEGWLKHPKTLVYTLLTCARFRHEDTCHAYTVNEAMKPFVLEKEHDGTLCNVAFDRRTFEPITPADTENARSNLLRLCDWIESLFHYETHSTWYGAPDCFSDDRDKAHLASIGFAQRHLAKFSERDRKCWEGIHARAAAKHGADLKAWGTVGKMQHDPEPRTWTHPIVDACIIGLWPLVVRYNWTHADLLKVLDSLLPAPPHNEDRTYPLDSEASLKVHCRSVCGLTKSKKGKSADKMPEGWPIAAKLFPGMGK